MPNFRSITFRSDGLQFRVTVQPIGRSKLLRLPWLARHWFYRTGSSLGVRVALTRLEGGCSLQRRSFGIELLDHPHSVQKMLAEWECSDPDNCVIESNGEYLSRAGDYEIRLLIDPANCNAAETIADMKVLGRDDVGYGVLTGVGGAVVVLLGVLLTHFVTTRQSPIAVNITAPSANGVAATRRQRTLEQFDLTPVAAALSKYKGTQIGVAYHVGDNEAQSLAVELIDLLKQAGWQAAGPSAAITDRPLYGVQLEFPGPNEGSSPALDALGQALQRMDFGVVAIYNHQPAALYVGSAES